MQRAAGDDVDRAELDSRFSLPVFCVSSIEHQKLAGVRTADGPATVWRDVVDTQIPALRKHMHRATLAQRARTVRRQAESLIQFGSSMLAFCEDGGELKSDARTALAAIFDSQFSAVPQKLAELSVQFDRDLAVQFDKKIAPRLKTGVADASKDCLAKAQEWSGTWRRGGADGGGLHWATYKACCRREGEWRVNMNEELASPILTSVSSAWESVFVKDLHVQLVRKYITIWVYCASEVDRSWSE